LILLVLWTAFFLINFNIAMMIPLLPFIQQAQGITTAEAGWVLAAFPIAALASNLVLGPWIDRFGRRRFIVLGAAGCAVCFVATAVSTGAWALVASRVVTGAFMPMVGASVFAAIADYVPIERRAAVSGYVTTAAPVAFLLSMSLGVVLGGLFAWQVPLVLVAVLSAGLAGFAARLPPTPAEGLSAAPISLATYRSRLLSDAVGDGTRLVLLAFLCWSAAVFVFLGLYPTWIVQRELAAHGPAGIGAMLFLGEIGGLAGALLAGRLSRAFAHPLAVCAIAAFATAAVVLVMPFGHGSAVFQAIAYMGFAFGRDLMLALILGGAMLLVPSERRGSLNAIMNATYQSGATAGGLLSAWMYGLRPDFTGNAGISACLLVVCGVSLWRVVRRGS
jgi:predicted MFS family arabinose efflux permease